MYPETKPEILHVGEPHNAFLTSIPEISPRNLDIPYSFLNSFASNSSKLRIFSSLKRKFAVLRF